MDPVSPPETPVTASPAAARKTGLFAGRPQQQQQRRQQQQQQQQQQQHQEQHTPRYAGAVRPSGRLFSVRSGFRSDVLSPRSSGDEGGDAEFDGDADADDADDADDDDGADADDDDDDDDDDARSDSSSESPASGSGLRSSSSAARSSPPILSARPSAGMEAEGGAATPRRQAGHRERRLSGSVSPASVPGRAPGDTAAPRYVAVVTVAWTIEEMGACDSDDGGRIPVLLPCAIEEAESSDADAPPAGQPPRRTSKLPLRLARTRRRSSALHARPPPPLQPEIDHSVMHGLRGFSLRQAEGEEEGDDDDDDDDDDNDEAIDDGDLDDHELFRQMHREARRWRRMTSGSISKRTISESMGSDTDTEDLTHAPGLEAGDVGSSARRLRRRLDRHSLQFSDPPPPPPRIEELDEPETGVEEGDEEEDGEDEEEDDDDDDDDVRELSRDGEALARELPYFSLEYISMEVDSP